MKTDETTKWTNIPQYNANTITRFRNYMRDRVKYTDAEVALIGVFIACESITLNKTELNMGVFSSEGTEGGAGGTVDDSNTNYIADAEWQAGELDGDPVIPTAANALNSRYCKITNLPIGEYTLHHDSYTHKRVCIKGYDEPTSQSILMTSSLNAIENSDDITFKISCSDTIVYISAFTNNSDDLSRVTLKRRDLPTPSVQDKILDMSIVGKPGWADQGNTQEYNLIEFKVASTTEIPDVTDLRTISIGDDTYYAAWIKIGGSGGSYTEKYPGKCIINSAYLDNWYVIVSLPVSKYGTTADSFKSYCANNGITAIILNSSNATSGGGSSVVTTNIETTWEKGYIKRNKGAVTDGTAGQVSMADSDCTCDFIPVQPGDVIKLQTNLVTGKAIGVVAYDNDKNYLSTFVPTADASGNGTGTWDVSGISVEAFLISLIIDNLPEGTAYIRICINLSIADAKSAITKFTLSHKDNTGGSKLLTYTLKATVSPADTMDKVVWSVAPEGICTVSNGKVTAIANGDCVVTATCGQQSATCNINVSGITTDGNLLTGINWESGTINNSGQLQTSTLDYRTELFELPEGCYRFSSSNMWKKAIKYGSDNNYVVQDVYDKAGNTNDIVFHSNKNTKFRLIASGQITDATVTKLEGNATKSKTYTGADIIQLTPSYSNANYVGVEVNFDGITSLDTFRGLSYTGRDDIYTGTYSIYNGKLYFNLFISKSIASGLTAVQEYFNANTLEITFHYTN